MHIRLAPTRKFPADARPYEFSIRAFGVETSP